MERLSAETAFSEHAVDVSVGRYRRADGIEVQRGGVEPPGSVAILAHDEESVYLVSQPREAVGEDALLEIPAGTLDVPGETELECARRELSEECGLRAERWRLLKTILPSPGVLSEKVWIFAATGLSPAPGVPDADEQIEVVRLPLAEIEPALVEIEDATTVVALLMLAAERRA